MLIIFLKPPKTTSYVVILYLEFRHNYSNIKLEKRTYVENGIPVTYFWHFDDLKRLQFMKHIIAIKLLS